MFFQASRGSKAQEPECRHAGAPHQSQIVRQQRPVLPYRRERRYQDWPHVILFGVESIELGIYNWDNNAGVFQTRETQASSSGTASVVSLARFHSGQSKGGLTSSHIAYASSDWWLLQRIEAKFTDAVFYLVSASVRIPVCRLPLIAILGVQ